MSGTRVDTALVRVMTAVRAGYGAAQLARPGFGIDRLIRHPLDQPARITLRVVGGRHVAQALAGAAAATTTTLAAGAAIDFLHAVTMVAAATGLPHRRVEALLSAGIAAAFGVTGIMAARSLVPPATEVPRATAGSSHLGR